VRTIGSATLSVMPSTSYGLDISHTNYGIAQEAGLRALNDTFRVAQVNRSFMVSQRYSRTNRERTLVISLTMGLQQLQDLNPFGTYASAENEVLYGNLFFTRIRTRDNLAINGGLNATRNTTVAGEQLMAGPSLGYSLPLAKGKLDHMLNASWNGILWEGSTAGHLLNIKSSLLYRYSPVHRFRFTVSVLQSTTTHPAVAEMTEVRITGGYEFVLRPKPKTP
jgi:hypothetical protein